MKKDAQQQNQYQDNEQDTAGRGQTRDSQRQRIWSQEGGHTALNNIHQLFPDDTPEQSRNTSLVDALHQNNAAAQGMMHLAWFHHQTPETTTTLLGGGKPTTGDHEDAKTQRLLQTINSVLALVDEDEDDLLGDDLPWRSTTEHCCCYSNNRKQ